MKVSELKEIIKSLPDESEVLIKTNNLYNSLESVIYDIYYEKTILYSSFKVRQGLEKDWSEYEQKD